MPACSGRLRAVVPAGPHPRTDPALALHTPPRILQSCVALKRIHTTQNYAALTVSHFIPSSGELRVLLNRYSSSDVVTVREMDAIPHDNKGCRGIQGSLDTPQFRPFIGCDLLYPIPFGELQREAHTAQFFVPHTNSAGH